MVLNKKWFCDKVVIKTWCSSGLKRAKFCLNFSNELVKRSVLACPAADRGFSSSLSRNDFETLYGELDSS